MTKARAVSPRRPERAPVARGKEPAARVKAPAPAAVCVALLRGINVGRANRISMDALRGVFASIGLAPSRTVLNSGNVIFSVPRPDRAALARAIGGALTSAAGITAPVTVVTTADLAAIVRDNPLVHAAKDPARHLVAFAPDAASLDPIRRMCKDDWAPDILAVGANAAYLWCEEGLLESALSKAFARAAKNTVTLRNWSTVLKLLAACSSG